MQCEMAGGRVDGGREGGGGDVGSSGTGKEAMCVWEKRYIVVYTGESRGEESFSEDSRGGGAMCNFKKRGYREEERLI